ncbi:hypothetical protein AUQ37_02630 [Candidatus Methanomethylophilus sp. 1R26]|uniref:DUF3850 domain-containing protein n=1 Tax=Candidatus Methanomethylophilus sp. 1R26 TaxID=1769296 RepID=UPI0007361B9E|nr:DUF3850 domain-containing protein [Candidatus Methanomethylophilus sp. 1R26]KUE73341.1 hypothetical protein AUQ37_02630 [Candidatus Methanomethylophilus sp. 1R26]
MIRQKTGHWLSWRPKDEQLVRFGHEMAARAWEWGDDGAHELDRLLDSCRVHHIKIRNDWYDMLLTGKKTCEIRRDDRGYEIGDKVCLHEVIPTAGGDEATGRMLTRRISLVIKTEGIAEGYCLLCFAPEGPE